MFLHEFRDPSEGYENRRGHEDIEGQEHCSPHDVPDELCKHEAYCKVGFNFLRLIPANGIPAIAIFTAVGVAVY
jgi:hypothetical protein